MRRPRSTVSKIHSCVTKGPDALGKFLCILRKNCHHFRDTSAPGDFFSHQILSSITKLQRRRRPALEMLGVKTVQILQFARHDLKKKFLSAPTITKLKIWQRQILSRFLDGPNKFCQSSVSGPLASRNYQEKNRQLSKESNFPIDAVFQFCDCRKPISLSSIIKEKS